MSIGLGVVIEGLVAALLLITIAYCIMLNKRLARLNIDLHSGLVGVRILFDVIDHPPTEQPDDDKPPLQLSTLVTVELHGPDWRTWHADTTEVPIASRVAVRALEAGAQSDLTTAMALETASTVACFLTEDAREGIAGVDCPGLRAPDPNGG